MSKEVAAKKDEQLPMQMEMFDELETVSGTGFENVTANDLAIPFYSILQALSPQVKKGPLKIEGAEEGDIYNTVTQEVIKGDEGITVVPCCYRKRWVEWVPRDQQGGFVAQHEKCPEGIKQVTTQEGRIKSVLPNGHDIIETAYFLVLRLRQGMAPEKAIIAMSSTQHKAAKKWVKMQMDFTITSPAGKLLNLPGFAQIYHLTTKMESKGNNSWAGWEIGAPAPITEKSLFTVSKEFYEFVRDENPMFTPPVEQEEAPSSTDAF